MGAQENTIRAKQAKSKTTSSTWTHDEAFMYPADSIALNF